MNLAQARTVADAVLYEGYLLYPYRATSAKNQVRWQFGVLGPPAAAAAGFGEPPDLVTECVVCGADLARASITVHLRFLQLQAREVERTDPGAPSGFTPVDALVADGTTWVSWEEAVEHEVVLGPFPLGELTTLRTVPVEVEGGDDEEELRGGDGVLAGRMVRRRRPLHGRVQLTSIPVVGNDELSQLRVEVVNTSQVAVGDRGTVARLSFLGAHALLVVDEAVFVSLLDPPEPARTAVARCGQHRCFPVLVGTDDERRIMLVSPIILYDHPQVAEQSAGALYDSTEIDEILTLRIMTMTDDEKAAARSTDPRAAAIIDRCDGLSPETLQAMHGVLRDPHLDLDEGVPTFGGPVPSTGDGLPWWDPGVDGSVSPETDVLVVEGVAVAKGSMVRLRPNRRADAQDLFFAGQVARVTGVLHDVDGAEHVAVVLDDDPAADLHDWYGRYLYFGPDEIEPLAPPTAPSSAPSTSGKEG